MLKRQFNQSIILSIAFMISSFSSVMLVVNKASAQVVVAITGVVKWKPPGGRFNPVYERMTLRRGSLLQLEEGASVRISCPDGQRIDWTTQGTSGLARICSPARTVSGRIITPRNGAQDIPYAILPRATAILTNKPTLRWNAGVGANSFTLTVRGEGLNWTKQVNRSEVCSGQTCEFTYPGNPPLQLGTAYRLVIEADNGRSSAEETTGGLGFKLLDAAQPAEVNQILERIKAQGLSDISEALALANLYASYDLVSEAIQALEAVSQSQKTAEVYRQLGDLYRQIGLPLEAEVQYTEAIELAKPNNKLELAAAQAGLGEVNYALGRRDKALQLLQAAKTAYEELGDSEKVNELEERLTQVQS